MPETAKYVPPALLTTLLPFGRDKDGNYRFSICIDLKSYYGVDEQKKPNIANPSGLEFLINNFGRGDNSIYQNVLSGTKIVSSKTKQAISFKNCFFEQFNKSIVQKYWNLLLAQAGHENDKAATVREDVNRTGEPAYGASVRAVELLDKEYLEQEPNKVFAYNVLQIANEDNPDTYAEKLGSTIERFMPGIKQINDNLDAAYEFSVAREEEQSAFVIKDLVQHFTMVEYYQQKSSNAKEQRDLYRKGILAQNNNAAFTPENIFDIFSFISSNSILQRLFGLTIDIVIPSSQIDQLFDVGNEYGLTMSNSDLEEKNKNAASPFKWEPLTTRMKLIENEGKTAKAVVVAPRKGIISSYFARNYDIASKYKSLENLEKKIKKYKDLLQNANTESERTKIVKELVAIDSAPLTRGTLIYDAALKAKNEAYNKSLEDLDKQNSIPELYEEDVITGHKYGIINGGGIISLGKRRLAVTDKKNKEIKIPEELSIQEYAINGNSGTNSLLSKDKSTDKELGLVVDPAILTWSGENIGMPSLFSNTEEYENFDSTEEEGSISNSTKFVTKLFLKFFKEQYTPTTVTYNGTIKGLDQVDIHEEKDITISYSAIKKHKSDPTLNAKLLLGSQYYFVQVPVLKNGYSDPFNQTDINHDKQLCYTDFPKDSISKPISFNFKRNEPVKHVEFYAQDNLLNEQKAVEGREGESLTHLVIRNYNSKDTDQQSIRHILPPAISFEHAFWHNKIFEMHEKYGKKETHKWYKKYHFPVKAGDPVKDKDGNIVKGEFYSEEDAIDGSIKMKDHYPDKWYLLDSYERRRIINYLPDPLCKGFRLEFFLDNERTIKATEYADFEKYECYFSGEYPYINAWRIRVKDIYYDKPLVAFDDEEIYLHIEKGRELFITVRTILDDSYEQQFDTHGNYNEFTKYGNNDLLTPPLKFSVVHAMQKPLVIPQFNNTLVCTKPQNSAVLSLTNSIKLEQLDIFEDKAGVVKYIDGTIPTGGLELYTTWEEYKDDPAHLIHPDDNWNPNQAINPIDPDRLRSDDKNRLPSFETKVEFTKQQLASMQRALTKIANDNNDSVNYATNIDVLYDIHETRFIEKWFWMKSLSRFSCYFSSDLKETEPESLEGCFSSVSPQPFLIKILNSKKPNKPKINKILPLVLIDDLRKHDGIRRKTSFTRLRIYLERGRLSSGKGERVGIMLNEPASPYNDNLVMNNLISMTGKDIVSDSVKPYDGLYRNENVLLQKSNLVVHDPYDLTDQNNNPAEDLESFDPKYISDLGCITYLPAFDAAQNLWYFDIELDVNDENGHELHSPFIKFSLVHYQENSFNYNENKFDESVVAIENDCRISDVENAGYIYILPSRIVEVTHAAHKELKVALGADETSLKIKDNTRFYAFIQRLEDDFKWVAAKNKEGQDIAEILSPGSGKATTIDYSKAQPGPYRLLVAETEDWNVDKKINIHSGGLKTLINDHKSRIILTTIFEL